MSSNTASPFARPLFVTCKPAGAACNLDCDYCYYTEKSHIYGGCHEMSEELAREFVRQYIGIQTTRQVVFIWHGGEPTLRRLDFYRKIAQWQHEFAQGHEILNSLQTNGTQLDDEWCRFLKDEDWSVGLSIDGPDFLHDKHRRDKTGRATHRRVTQAAERLSRFGVEWNAMAAVTSSTAQQPEAFYEFFRAIGCRSIQLSPVVERRRAHADGRHLAAPCETGRLEPYSVAPDAWGSFLCRVFDLWASRDVGKVFVELFDSTLAQWCGQPPSVCTLSAMCGHAAAIEWNGDLYCCDHYVFPRYRLGNIRSESLMQMLTSRQQRDFAAMKTGSLPTECRECRWLFACHGECPRNRFVLADGQDAPSNYLCSGYRSFFAHVAPYMDYMRRQIELRRSPANVMRLFAQRKES